MTSFYLNQKLIYPKITLGQEGFLSNIESGIKNYITSQWDNNHPVASLVNIIGPSLLFRVNPILGILYELTEALGFDWRGLIEAVGQDLVNLFSSSSSDPSKDQIHSAIQASITSNFQEHFTGSENLDKIKELAPKLEPLLSEASIKELHSSIRKFGFVKDAGALSWLSKMIAPKFSSFWGKVLSWLITTIVLMVGGGALRGALGIKTSPVSENPITENSKSDFHPATFSLLSPSLSPDLTDFHQNDLSHLWAEKGDINNIDQYLIDGILEAYPSLQDKKEEIMHFPAFLEVENAFRQRNQYSENTGMFFVPRPYQRKLDFIGQIVNQFLSNNKA